MFQWPDPGKAFDVALHIETPLALIVYFRKDLADVLRSKDRKLFTMLFIGCLPLPIVALVDKKLERLSNPDQFAQAPVLIAVFLIAFALLLKWADNTGRKKREMSSIIALGRNHHRHRSDYRGGVPRRFAVGHHDDVWTYARAHPRCGGAVLLPALRAYHWRRRDLRSTQVPQAMTSGGAAPLLVGIAASGLVGDFAVAFLMDYVKRKSMDVLWNRRWRGRRYWHCTSSRNRG